MDINFVLVEPKVPENIGASARAIKTMGFSSLRLVKPCDHLDDQAQRLAHGSVEILKNATVYNDFKSALGDIDFIVGTTSKHRLLKADYYSCREILDLIVRKKTSIQKVAIVFGREDKGLLNNELKYCQIVSSIPMKNHHPSLNLSQSVMLYAYSLSPLSIRNYKKLPRKTDQLQFKSLIKRVDKIMENIGMDPESRIFNRIKERLGSLNEGDTHLIHSLCNMLNFKLQIKDS